MTAIEFTAFAWCGGLTSVAIPNGVTTIGSAAFESCSALKSLTIPASVSSIGTGAFADCKNLKKIEFCHAANIPLTFEEYSNPSAGNGSNTFILNNAANFATTVIVPDKNNINPAISGYNWAGDNRTVEYKSASDSPRHAPNMYVDWITGNAYDVISVDWYCDKDANNTYWAVHNWDGGYAGFQNKDGQHVLLLSLWDLADGTSPTIEYSLSGENGSFGGEGTGKQVFTNYDWQVGKWYTMCIQVSSNNDKSYYTQYVKEENGDWLKTAVISYPITGNKFFGSSVFQEDFTFNNLMRSCRLRNASGRIYGTDTWESWNNCKISNSFFPTDSATWESGVQLNIDFDCNWDNHGDYVWVQSGGEGFDSNGKQIPVEYSLSNPSIPAKSLFDKQDSSSEKVSVNLNEIAADKAASGGFVAIDMNGNRHTVYGGIVYRSIGYIAYQNRNAFSPTDPAYDYIWDIIHHVYGDKYDTEYKK